LRSVLFTIDSECDRMLKEIEKIEGKGKNSEFVRKSIKHYYNEKHSDKKKIPDDVEMQLMIIAKKNTINMMVAYFKNLLKGNKKAIAEFSDKLRKFWWIDPEFVKKVATIGVTMDLTNIETYFKKACAWISTKKEVSKKRQAMYETLFEMRLYPKTMDGIKEAMEKNELTIKIAQDKVYVKGKDVK